MAGAVYLDKNGLIYLGGKDHFSRVFRNQWTMAPESVDELIGIRTLAEAEVYGDSK